MPEFIRKLEIKCLYADHGETHAHMHDLI